VAQVVGGERRHHVFDEGGQGFELVAAAPEVDDLAAGVGHLVGGVLG